MSTSYPYVLPRRVAALLILTCAFTAVCFAQSKTQTFLLEGSPAVPGPQQGRDTTSSKDTLIGGRTVVRLGEVTVPTVTWFPAAPVTGQSAPAFLVLPGGGYQILATDLEGTEVCTWLNAHGISALLLRYRVPSGVDKPQPLADAQAALALLGHHAVEWSVDLNHVGVIGFSAGAHLAMRLISGQPVLPLRAAMIIYPAYLETASGGLSTGAIPISAPAFFLVQAQDDPIGVGNALTLYRELVKTGVSAEVHLFATGGHGFGLRPTPQAATHWPDLAAKWLAANGFLPHTGAAE